ncbi:hypothetical protein [Fictibacillus barbaricus]|uniref:hypothetical protein n=1 Tax=Fictibacillus barbaricus TaxID=182136 RepID=UPI00166A25B8|nr:hypothetical protein [Fictibacillus barbaricus]
MDYDGGNLDQCTYGMLRALPQLQPVSKTTQPSLLENFSFQIILSLRIVLFMISIKKGLLLLEEMHPFVEKLTDPSDKRRQ